MLDFDHSAKFMALPHRDLGYGSFSIRSTIVTLLQALHFGFDVAEQFLERHALIKQPNECSNIQAHAFSRPH